MMLAAMTERDAHLGRVVTGRVASGTARVGDALRVLHYSGVHWVGAAPYIFLVLQRLGLLFVSATQQPQQTVMHN